MLALPSSQSRCGSRQSLSSASCFSWCAGMVPAVELACKKRTTSTELNANISDSQIETDADALKTSRVCTGAKHLATLLGRMGHGQAPLQQGIMMARLHTDERS